MKEPNPTVTGLPLLEHRPRPRAALADPVLQRAEQTVRHADRNTALTGDSVTSKDLDIYRARRAEEIRELPEDPEQPLVGAGVDPATHRAAVPEERERIAHDAAARLTRERDLTTAAQ